MAFVEPMHRHKLNITYFIFVKTSWSLQEGRGMIFWYMGSDWVIISEDVWRCIVFLMHTLWWHHMTIFSIPIKHVGYGPLSLILISCSGVRHLPKRFTLLRFAIGDMLHSWNMISQEVFFESWWSGSSGIIWETDCCSIGTIISPPKCCYFVVVGGLACLADPRGYASWSFDSW